jgi:phage recombination protein Bet
MTKEIATQQQPIYTKEQLALITRTVAVGATPDELSMFLHVAKKSKLDPFLRQIHFVKRGGKATIQVGIDGYRAIADRTGHYAGNDDPKYEYNDKNELVKASVTVYKIVGGQKCAFTASALWDEYVPQAGQDFMWQKMPHVMLAKVAESLALRKAFPNDLAGLYTQEEMAQSGEQPTIADTAAGVEQMPDPDPKEELPTIDIGDPEESEEVVDIADVPEVVAKEETPFRKAIKKTSGAKYAA